MERKKWLSPVQQVEHLKSKGVKFDLMSEPDAVAYLERNNNYFRLRSYRTGFPKVEKGSRAGEYANLDFKMLVDLSIIDMRLRYEMLPLTLDIEHFAKVRLLMKIEEHGEDGYSIVQSFLDSYDEKTDGLIKNRIKNEIDLGKKSPYVCNLVAKYADYAYPAWAFVEVISFGTFNYFYKFCGEQFQNKEMRDQFYLLQSVKSLRNACAHNNCIINDLRPGTSKYAPRFAVSSALGKIPGIGSGQRRTKMSNDRIQQIVTTLYVHSRIASPGVHRHRAATLHQLVERMNRENEYYSGNLQIRTTFEFLSKVIADWFSFEAGVEDAAQSLDATSS